MNSRAILFALLCFVAGCAGPPRLTAPAMQGGTTPRIAMTAHPLATRAALAMLDRGGNAAGD